MNDMFGEVLQEVLMGLLITKPDVKRSRIRRFPGTKKVLRRCGFALGCHVQTMREREKETNRKAPSIGSTKYGNKKVCRHEQCMIM